MKLTDFLTDLGHPVAYYPSLVDLTDSLTSTLFMCQLLYWKGKEQDKDGWIYKTQEEIGRETGLSRSEQESARKRLRELGFIEEKFSGLPRKLYYRPCPDKIHSRWLEVREKKKEKTLKNQHNAEIPHYCMQESCIIDCGNPALLHAENQQAILQESRRQECGNPADNNAGIPQAYYTEITTETTTEIKKNNPDEFEQSSKKGNQPPFFEKVSEETFSPSLVKNKENKIQSLSPAKESLFVRKKDPPSKDIHAEGAKNPKPDPLKDIRSQIEASRSRYTGKELEVIDLAIEAFASTRKTYQVSEQIILNQFKRWEQHQVNQVIEGLSIYLEKDCAAQGKAEDYALGIIRNLAKQKGPYKQKEKREYERTLDPEQEESGIKLDEDEYAHLYIRPGDLSKM
ncbi:MAG: hypothetical protein HY730_06250 [Candidatus Tectomicrobia bacterium]|uniref:DnaD domain-containing protein n=1 Tax=Tectimicrobiota bacterium TaxID=2528274 RepID=A0A933LQQ6_UNCTE|nr:hypothetical protein [Candidatus Tectomicrobia bacterium]